MQTDDKNKNEIHLTKEEHEAVDREWKLFMAQAPKEEISGEWYAPKGVAETMQKTIASHALFDLAEDYLRRTNGSSIERIDDAEKSNLFEKAITSALKAASIDPDPLNTYKAGIVLEKAGKINDAKTYYRLFLDYSSDLLKNENENYRITVQRAIDDVKSKNIL